MQNKANFQKVKLNVTKVLRRVYDQLDTWSIRKTKPIQSQSKPIQSQLKPIQSQLKPIKANKMPKQTQFKPKLVRHQCGGQTQCLPAISVAGLPAAPFGGTEKISTRHNSSKYKDETIYDKTNSMNNVYLRAIEAYNGIEMATWLFEPSLLQERL
jgi:hypothetical protein